jgi:predicted metal-dependent hydrolase
MAVETTILSAMVTGELGATTTQATTLLSGCLSVYLKTLNANDKAVMGTVTASVRESLTVEADLLQKSQTKIRTEIDWLNTEITALGTSKTQVNNLYRLLGGSIATCADAYTVAQNAKVYTDRVNKNQIELKYRLMLAESLRGKVSTQVEEIQKTIGILDQINYIMGAI